MLANARAGNAIIPPSITLVEDFIKDIAIADPHPFNPRDNSYRSRPVMRLRADPTRYFLVRGINSNLVKPNTLYFDIIAPTPVDALPKGLWVEYGDKSTGSTVRDAVKRGLEAFISDWFEGVSGAVLLQCQCATLATLAAAA